MNERALDASRLDDRRDADLVVEAADGDQHAFAVLFRRHGADVVRLVERRCGSAATADDVTAAAFESAWHSLSALRDRRIEFRPWVFRLAINELVDVQRAASRRTAREVRAARRDGPLASSDPTAGPATDHDTRIVRSAMATLSPSHQEVLTMRYVADLEPSEIAEVLGVAKGTVAVRTHRAAAAMRRAIENELKGAAR